MERISSDRERLCAMAQCAFEAVNRLLSRDQSLAEKLRSSMTGSRQIIREETITAEMAMELVDKFPGNIEITLFTPSEEARTGADWYWRFERDGGAVHARVQAKRVQRSKFWQPDRSGHVEINREQLSQLIENAGELPEELSGLETWVATFARFPATPPCGKLDLQECQLHRHQARCNANEPSIWIANAQDILGLEKSRLSVRDVVAESLRLDCILPCTDLPGVDAGPATKGFTLRRDLGMYQDCVSTIRSNPQMRAQFTGAIRVAA